MAKRTSTTPKPTVPLERIAQTILFVRGQKVMLDADLAALYGVTTKRLNEQVKRNRERFPVDFMFEMTAEEKAEVVANCDHLGNLKFSPVMPNAFTEHGALMAASVLNTARAVEVSVYVVRAFVSLRELLPSNHKLAVKLDELEHKLGAHDQAINEILQAIRQMMTPAAQKRKRSIGFAEWEV